MNYSNRYDDGYGHGKMDLYADILAWIEENSVYMYDSKGHIYDKKGFDVSDNHLDGDGDIQLIPAIKFLKKLEEM